MIITKQSVITSLFAQAIGRIMEIISLSIRRNIFRGRFMHISLQMAEELAGR